MPLPISPYELFLDVVGELFSMNLKSPKSYSVTPGWDFESDDIPGWVRHLPQIMRDILLCADGSMDLPVVRRNPGGFGGYFLAETAQRKQVLSANPGSPSTL